VCAFSIPAFANLGKRCMLNYFNTVFGLGEKTRALKYVVFESICTPGSRILCSSSGTCSGRLI
jgi:hypothetical protein